MHLAFRLSTFFCMHLPLIPYIICLKTEQEANGAEELSRYLHSVLALSYTCTHTHSEICSVRLLPSPRCYHFLLIFILLLLKFQTFCFAVRLINISPHSCTVLLIVKRKNEKRKNFYIRFFYSSLCSMFASLFLFPSYHCILSINSTFNFLFSLRCTYCWAVVAAITIAAIVVRFCFCRSAFSFRSVHFIGLLCAIPIQLCSWLICAWFRNFSNFILKSGDIFAFESN